MSQMLPTTRHSINLVQRTNIAVLVGLSRLLRHLKPHRLQRLMSFVVRGAQPADYNIARDARDDILSASAVCRGDRACLIRAGAAMASRLQARVMAWRTALSVRGPEEALNMM